MVTCPDCGSHDVTRVSQDDATSAAQKQDSIGTDYRTVETFECNDCDATWTE